jgi:hypothetical protein
VAGHTFRTRAISGEIGRANGHEPSADLQPGCEVRDLVRASIGGGPAGMDD